MPQRRQTAAAGRLQQLAAEAVLLLTPAHSLQGPDLAIHHGDEVLDGMNAWSCEHHGASGLTARCRASTVSMQVQCIDLSLAVHLLKRSPRLSRSSCSRSDATFTGLTSLRDAGRREAGAGLRAALYRRHDAASPCRSEVMLTCGRQYLVPVLLSHAQPRNY